MGLFRTPTKKAAKNITLFVKGLIPKTSRSKLEEFPLSPDVILKAYNYFYQLIKYEFSKRKPKTLAERASILKELLEGKKIIHSDRFCEQWAEHKEPRKIAEVLIRDLTHLVYRYRDMRMAGDMIVLHPKIKVKDQYKIGLPALRHILKKSL